MSVLRDLNIFAFRKAFDINIAKTLKEKIKTLLIFGIYVPIYCVDKIHTFPCLTEKLCSPD